VREQLNAIKINSDCKSVLHLLLVLFVSMITTSNILPINSLLFYAVCCLLEVNVIHHTLYRESARSLRFFVCILLKLLKECISVYIHLYAK
jgi:hypothetical protein